MEDIIHQFLIDYYILQLKPITRLNENQVRLVLGEFRDLDSMTNESYTKKLKDVAEYFEK